MDCVKLRPQVHGYMKITHREIRLRPLSMQTPLSHLFLVHVCRSNSLPLNTSISAQNRASNKRATSLVVMSRGHRRKFNGNGVTPKNVDVPVNTDFTSVHAYTNFENGCPRQARGATNRPKVSLRARPVVPLPGMWCPC